MSYEDVECPACKRIGQNVIDEDVPVRGYPSLVSKWLICRCGHDIMEIEE